MEYVGGTSLKSILKQRMREAGGATTRCPPTRPSPTSSRSFPAFQYLHDLGLVYCDFKPDNLIQVGDMVKLIDLGGVRRIDDDDSAIFGTVGSRRRSRRASGTDGRVATSTPSAGRWLC